MIAHLKQELRGPCRLNLTGFLHLPSHEARRAVGRSFVVSDTVLPVKEPCAGRRQRPNKSWPEVPPWGGSGL